MNLAVVLFAYQRPKTLKKALATHTLLKDADYYCFIDYSKMQEEIAKIVYDTGLYPFIIKRSHKYGLNRNIIDGITEIFTHGGYDAVIVLEDDLKIAKDGLRWLQTMLIAKDGDDRYGSVCLNKGDVLNKRFRCWGWGTWKYVWENIDWDIKVFGQYEKRWNKTQSWDYYVAFWMELNQLYARASSFERVKHIGYIGVHYKWYAQFGIRQYYRAWKENYYRDKDIIMKKEKFPYNLFRFIKDL